MENRKILIVDDEEGVLETYRNYLEFPRRKQPWELSRKTLNANQKSHNPSEYFEIVCVNSGEKAVEVAMEHFHCGKPFAGGFIDVRMPGGMDGMETISIIHDFDPEMYCTIVTAYQEYSMERLNHIFSPHHLDRFDYLNKPFYRSEIVQKARVMVAGWNLKRSDYQYKVDLQFLLDQIGKLQRIDLSINQQFWQELLHIVLDFLGTKNGFIMLMKNGDLDFVTGMGTYSDKDIVAKYFPYKSIIKHFSIMYDGKPLHVFSNFVSINLKYNNNLYLVVVPEVNEIDENKRTLVEILVSSCRPAIEKAVLFEELRNNNSILQHTTREQLLQLEKLDSELKITQDQLIHTSKMSAIGELASGIAHEINSPLTGVVGFSELLMDSNLTESQQQKLRKIISCALRCKNIINQLLVFGSNHEKHREILDVRTVINDALSFLKFQSQHYNIQVEVEYPDEVILVHADKQLLEQVFINLCKNSYDAINHKSSEGNIKIVATLTNESVIITVSDNGHGINNDHKENIFKPFFSTKNNGNHPGLGLSICQDILDDHEGKIYLAETGPGGSSFVVELPRAEENQDKNHGPTQVNIDKR